MKNVLVEWTPIYGVNKGKVVKQWFMEYDTAINDILSDKRLNGKIIETY